MVIHLTIGILIMGIYVRINGWMTIPFYGKPNHVLTEYCASLVATLHPFPKGV